MWLKIKVWTKVALASLLALYVLAFILKNTTQEVTFWWWINRTNQTSVFMLAILAFVAGIVGAVLLRTTWITLRQIRELKRRSQQQKMERDLADMKSKAGMLRTRPGTEKPGGEKPATPTFPESDDELASGA